MILFHLAEPKFFIVPSFVDTYKGALFAGSCLSKMAAFGQQQTFPCDYTNRVDSVDQPHPLVFLSILFPLRSTAAALSRAE